MLLLLIVCFFIKKNLQECGNINTLLSDTQDSTELESGCTATESGEQDSTNQTAAHAANHEPPRQQPEQVSCYLPTVLCDRPMVPRTVPTNRLLGGHLGGGAGGAPPPVPPRSPRNKNCEPGWAITPHVLSHGLLSHAF